MARNLDDCRLLAEVLLNRPLVPRKPAMRVGMVVEGAATAAATNATLSGHSTRSVIAMTASNQIPNAASVRRHRKERFPVLGAFRERLGPPEARRHGFRCKPGERVYVAVRYPLCTIE